MVCVCGREGGKGREGGNNQIIEGVELVMGVAVDCYV